MHITNGAAGIWGAPAGAVPPVTPAKVRPAIGTPRFYAPCPTGAAAGGALPIGSSREVLDHWFQGDTEQPNQDLWFGGDQDTDDEIRRRFGADVETALAGGYDEWRQAPRGRLALVLLLDQFTRNIYRGTAKAFAGDRAAQRHAAKGVMMGDDGHLRPLERAFLYMPFMHAEDASLQRRGVVLFDRLYHDGPGSLREALGRFRAFAADHAYIIERFGRFPDRNAILGRETTPEEARFLEAEPRPWFEPASQARRPPRH